MEGSEYNDTIKRSIIRSDCPPKEESSEIQIGNLDLGLCPREEVIASQRGNVGDIDQQI